MIDRKELHRLVDKLPEEKLPRMNDFFRHLFDEEELELNDETKKELDEARERVKDGKYVTLNELLEETRDV
ncbi:hypothetical protein SAMN05216238_107113 [Lentibacillus persicus]|uniref:Uncharacterized protein n=1 Tax=Lentibacillus persicus TaxID=640948 RepID=A0A1I1XB96_9BACI|nr:hypothetical protein [Lentibacillus persicus]SFE02640.1 hypothetical protein SAMN05216238_107113 [Lentibacillus persicus]